MARQDRWRTDERPYRDNDRGSPDRGSPDRGSQNGDYRYRSESRSDGYGAGSEYGRGGDNFRDGGRGEYRSRNEYDYGGSNFNRGDRTGPERSSGYADELNRNSGDRGLGGGYGGGLGFGDAGGYGREEYSRNQYSRDQGGYGAGRDFGRGDYRQSGYGQGGYGNGYGAGTSGAGYGRGSYGSGAYGDSYGDRARGYDERGGDRGFWERASDEVSSWFGDEGAERRRQQDQFRGRGPKGYNRSGDRIREDVSDRLSDDPQVDASEIEVEVSGNEVTLTGTVPSREQRRRAEDVAEHVSGVSYVQNNLRVQSQSGYQGSGYGGGLGSSVTGAGQSSAQTTQSQSLGQTAFGRDTSTGTPTTGSTGTGSVDTGRTKTTGSRT